MYINFNIYIKMYIKKFKRENYLLFLSIGYHKKICDINLLII